METKRVARNAGDARVKYEGGPFATLVLKWRTDRELTQPAAAARLGVPYRTWQDWEYGRRAPKGLALELITRKLNAKRVAKSSQGRHGVR